MEINNNSFYKINHISLNNDYSQFCVSTNIGIIIYNVTQFTNNNSNSSYSNIDSFNINNYGNKKNEINCNLINSSSVFNIDDYEILMKEELKEEHNSNNITQNYTEDTINTESPLIKANSDGNSNNRNSSSAKNEVIDNTYSNSIYTTKYTYNNYLEINNSNSNVNCDSINLLSNNCNNNKNDCSNINFKNKYLSKSLSYSGNIGDIFKSVLFYKYHVCAFVSGISNTKFSNNKLILWDNQKKLEINSKIFKSSINNIKLLSSIIVMQVDDELNIFKLVSNNIEYLTKFNCYSNSPYEIFLNSDEALFIVYKQYYNINKSFTGNNNRINDMSKRNIQIQILDKYFNNTSLPIFNYTNYQSSLSNIYMISNNQFYLVDREGRYFYLYNINYSAKKSKTNINNNSEIQNLKEIISFNSTYYRGNRDAKILALKEIESNDNIDKGLDKCFRDYNKNIASNDTLILCFSSTLTITIFIKNKISSSYNKNFYNLGLNCLKSISFSNYISSSFQLKLFTDKKYSFSHDFINNGLIFISQFDNSILFNKDNEVVESISNNFKKINIKDNCIENNLNHDDCDELISIIEVDKEYIENNNKNKKNKLYRTNLTIEEDYFCEGAKNKYKNNKDNKVNKSNYTIINDYINTNSRKERKNSINKSNINNNIVKLAFITYYGEVVLCKLERNNKTSNSNNNIKVYKYKSTKFLNTCMNIKILDNDTLKEKESNSNKNYNLNKDWNFIV